MLEAASMVWRSPSKARRATTRKTIRAPVCGRCRPDSLPRSAFLKRRGSFDRLIRGELVDSAVNDRDERIRIRAHMNEEPPAPNFLLKRMIDRHCGQGIDPLVINI